MTYMRNLRILILPALVALFCIPAFLHAQSFTPISAFPLSNLEPVISRPVQPVQPFTVAGERGVIVGTQDGSFESWILPVKLLSHLTIEANLEGYAVPIPVNPQAAHIEVRPDRTTITYSHAGFTLRQIMFSPDATRVPQVSTLRPGSDAGDPTSPSTGPIVLFQIDAVRPLDLVFRFTPEMRWMWPRRNEGIPSPEWVPSVHPATVTEDTPATGPGFYVLHLDYGDLAGAITIPTATPGIMAPYQERPQVHPLELHLHYDPKRDGTGENAKFFPLLMAVGTTHETASAAALGKSLQHLNDSIPNDYKAHTAAYEKLLANTTSIETPDPTLNQAFRWSIVSIEQLKALAYPGPVSPPGVTTPEPALVAGYYASADSARPGFGWFFGRDSLYTLYAVNSFGDFSLTRAELEFLIRRQRADGKIMHEFSQTAGDPTVDWKSFPYMYAAADATPLFLMAVRDYYRASGDGEFLKLHREAIEKAWSFETAPTSDTDSDGIYDNSQGTGWVESWPGGTPTVSGMPHQEIYLALLDEQASLAYAGLAEDLASLGSGPSSLLPAEAAKNRAVKIAAVIEQEYYDPQKGCYAFATNPPGRPNSPVDHTSTIYPAIAWWDYNQTIESSLRNKSSNTSGSRGTGFSPYINAAEAGGALAPEGLAHVATCLQQFAASSLDTDWGTRDVANNEPYYDGMSYHQGSVWPLFTGWAALAEYRANQPLPGEQLLMQNVDLTWAQDPGAVTELLSGDYFVPFGRSTSHQLWSSAMVTTPSLRGLFGISLDAATNTITVNPHLPASWKHAEIHNLHLGIQTLTLDFRREEAQLRISAFDPARLPTSEARSAALKPASARPAPYPVIHLHSDIPATRGPSQSDVNPVTGMATLSLLAPLVEVSLPAHALPAPGSRTEQLKVLSGEYATNRLTLTVQGAPGTEAHLLVHRRAFVPKLALYADQSTGATATLSAIEESQRTSTDPIPPEDLHIRFAAAQSASQPWQTTTLTLTW
jgi:glycogen debranching enzyme